MSELTEQQKERVKEVLTHKLPADTLETTEEVRFLGINFSDWDDYPTLLFSIIRHPKCDKGTALLLYWRSDPISFFELYANEEEALAAGEWSRDCYRLLIEIQDRYVAGFYVESDFHVNPEEEEVAGDFFSEELKTPIPDVMRQPI